MVTGANFSRRGKAVCRWGKLSAEFFIDFDMEDMPDIPLHRNKSLHSSQNLIGTVYSIIITAFRGRW